jgi:hypothetical protein
LNRQPNKRSTAASDKQLVITDSSLDNFQAVDPAKVEIIHKPNATYTQCKQLITDRSKSSYEKETLVIGATDCEGGEPIQQLSTKVLQLVHQAKAIAPLGEVCVSSVLPRLKDQKTQSRIEEMNSAIEDICNSTNTTFIENDPSFRLGDGEVNEGFLQEDGTSLNKAGCNKLLKNLHLFDLVQGGKQQPWKKVSREKPRNTQQKAPCWNCGESNHTSNICRYKKRRTCYKCGKQGHKTYKCGNH